MTAQAVVLADRRERDSVMATACELVAAMERGPGPMLHTSISVLLGLDWAYPALLAYRESGENRWNRVELGRLAPEMGED